jgi:hypothetical protein
MIFIGHRQSATVSIKYFRKMFANSRFLRDELQIVFEGKKISISFAVQTVIVAQLVRASDCGSEGRGFEPHQSP